MFYLLFTFYLGVGCFFVTRIRFIKDTGLSSKTLLILLLIKISAGILLGWMSQKFYPQGNDYWGLNDAGWKEYLRLVADPGQFFSEIFISPYPDSYGGFFKSTSYWNDLKNTLIGKQVGLFNILARGNYYINSLFFNFIGFFGHVALYRVFIDIYKDKKWAVIIGCFLLPSTIYFSSGIHKDLVVFTMMGLFCYALYFSLHDRFKIKYILMICLTWIILLIIRNFVVVAFLPATIALVISVKKRLNPLATFSLTYLAAFLLLIFTQYFSPSFQPIKIITQRQQDFFELPTASTQVKTYVLQPNIGSLVKNAPQALNHSLLRPYLWEHPTRFLIPLAIELFLYHLLFAFWLVWHKRNKSGVNPFVLCCLCFSINLLLFTGYIVPNIGSLVRYRSLYLPFFIIPILSNLNLDKIRKIIL